MYLSHFGLKEYPFSLTPDTALYFPWQAPNAILEALLFALSRGDGLLKVTGEVGSGKTLLSRLLLQKLEAEGWDTAYLNVPMAKAEHLPAEIAREFGLTASGDEAYRALCAFLLDQAGRGRSCVLVVDEAQALGAEGLEAIRLLSNLETDTRKLLPIVLFGQPELDRLLRLHGLRQVSQRVAFSFTTQALPPSVLAPYLQHRLQACGAVNAARIFTPSAVRLLSHFSRGGVRVTHLLADKALLAAFAAGMPEVTARHVRQARRDARDIRTRRWHWPWP